MTSISLLFISLAIGIPLNLYIIRFELSNKNPFWIVWITCLAIYGIPSWADLAIGSNLFSYHGHAYYADYNSIFVSQIYYYFCIITYLLAVNLISIFFPYGPILPDNIYQPLNRFNLLPLYFGLFLTSIACITLYFKYDRIIYNLNFVDARTILPFWIKFFIQSLPKFYLGYIVWFAVKNKITPIIIFITYFAFLYIFIGGTRQSLIQISACLFMYIIFYLRVAAKVKSPLLIVLLLIVIILYDFSYTIRGVGGFLDRINFISQETHNNLFSYFQVSDFNLRSVYYYFISNYNIPGLWNLEYFLRTLLLWLPTDYSFGIKPQDYEYTMFYLFTGDNATMHPTLPGSIFADSGPYFALWTTLIAAVRQFVQFGLTRLKGAYFAASYASCLISCIMLARGALYSAILVTMATICIYLILSSRFIQGNS